MIGSRGYVRQRTEDGETRKQDSAKYNPVVG